MNTEIGGESPCPSDEHLELMSIKTVAKLIIGVRVIMVLYSSQYLAVQLYIHLVSATPPLCMSQY